MELLKVWATQNYTSYLLVYVCIAGVYIPRRGYYFFLSIHCNAYFDLTLIKYILFHS